MAMASFSVTLRIRSGSVPEPGTSPFRVTFSWSRIRSTTSFGVGMKFRLVSLPRFSRIFSSASARLRSPAGLSATTPRKARVGRMGQSRLTASSLASTRSLTNFPAWCFTSTRSLPEQIPSSSAGVTPLASPFR